MFIIQRIKEEYEGEHGAIGWEELNSLETAMRGVAPLFPVNDLQIFSIPYICLMRYGIILLRPVRLPEKRLGYNHMQLSKLHGAELCLGDTGVWRKSAERKRHCLYGEAAARGM